MLEDVKIISKQITGHDDPAQADSDALQSVVARYPYFSAARYLVAHHDNADEDASVTASLYLNNPLRLHWLLNYHEPDPVQPADGEPPPPHIETNQTAQSTDESPIAFQSYHTIDYFASQGIRLQAVDLSRDRLGQQLKSFTEWLRSMKKLPASESDLPGTPEDPGRHQYVVQSAAHSIEAKEVLTEAMAEVWLKQGNRDKALGIYQKLSLQNPAKSDYFAHKIEQIKAL